MTSKPHSFITHYYGRILALHDLIVGCAGEWIEEDGCIEHCINAEESLIQWKEKGKLSQKALNLLSEIQEDCKVKNISERQDRFKVFFFYSHIVSSYLSYISEYRARIALDACFSRTRFNDFLIAESLHMTERDLQFIKNWSRRLPAHIVIAVNWIEAERGNNWDIPDLTGKILIVKSKNKKRREKC